MLFLWFITQIFLTKHYAALTLKKDLMAGLGLVQHLTTSRPTVITPQLGTKDNLPTNTGTGGLEDTRTDHRSGPQQDEASWMNHRELLRLQHLTYREIIFRF